MSEWGQIYKSIGAKPVINATGSVTLLGGSTPVREVKDAMDLADSAYVPLIELQKAAIAFGIRSFNSSLHTFCPVFSKRSSSKQNVDLNSNF